MSSPNLSPALPRTPDAIEAGDATHPSTFDIGDVHVLRLCLDLQLDALTLTIGAASAESRPADPPWRRWVAEDVELACSLAADTRQGGAALPHSMGSDLDRSVPSATLDNLLASYTSILTLLSGMSSRPGQDQEGTPRQRRVEQALEHCERRHAAIESYRLARPTLRMVDPADADQPTAAGAPPG